MAVRTELPDGCYHTRYDGGFEYWHNRDGRLHRLDGPARIWSDKDVAYYVNGKIPRSILDIVIIREEMDFEMFPSAELVSNYYDVTDMGRSAYRIHDSDELILAILRYG